MLLEKPALQYIQPMKPRLVETAPTGGDWLHEVKFDGYRTQIHVEAGRALAFSSSGAEWTRKYRPIVDTVARLRCTDAILDGEIYLPDARGASDFAGLPAAIRWHPEQLIFVAFDLLHLDGADLRARPIEDRRAALQELLASAPASNVAFSEELGVDGPEAFAAVEQMGLEGIVSKRRGSRYKSGLAHTWLKTKTFTESELEVIGADVTPTGAPVALLARRDAIGNLHYVGNAFITLKAGDRDAFWRYADANAIDEPAAKVGKRGTWFRPGMSARVRHLREDGYLRHATLKALQLPE